MTGPDIAAEMRRALANPAALCGALGLVDKSTKRLARGVLVRCPWHEERNPSCSVRVEADGTTWAHCFSCGGRGDALDLVAQVRGLDVRRDFAQVLAAAAELAGVRLEEARTAPERPRPVPVEAPALPDEAFAAIASPLLHLGRLDDSAIAGDVSRYLGRRYLLEEALRDGWAALPRADALASWVSMLEDLFPRLDLDACGLLSRGAFAFPENRLVIPWRRPDGTVYTLQRRRLDGQREKKYVFPFGRPTRWPYGIERLGELGPDAPLVFVEGAVDALARRALDRQAGTSRVVLGVPGTAGWRSEWAELARGRDACIATDADQEGERVVDRWSADLYAAGAVQVTRLEPVDAKDWTEALAS